jgi:hypothetical protein
VERFRTDNNPHLKQIQDADPNLFNAWKALSFERTLEALTESSQDFSFTDFLKEKFHDGHFTQESLPIVAQFLTSQTTLQKKEDPEFASAQKECIELMQSSPSQEILLQKLPKIIAILEKKSPSLELINDLKTLIHSLHPHKHQKETVVFTKKWQDLFVAGSEVGSCQRLDGSADLNKCLLAYCLDGKNGMIAVQDEIGTTVARAILRLLLDPSTNKPTLFLERLYPNPISSHRQKAILDAAKECAKTLGCKVFILSDDTSGTKLISKGSSCPYEYVDASGGVKKEGVFSVYGKELT